MKNVNSFIIWSKKGPIVYSSRVTLDHGCYAFKMEFYLPNGHPSEVKEHAELKTYIYNGRGDVEPVRASIYRTLTFENPNTHFDIILQVPETNYATTGSESFINKNVFGYLSGIVYNLRVVCKIKILHEKPTHLLLKNLEQLAHYGNTSDVTLEVAGFLFPVHKSVLSAYSPVFDAMFRCNMIECNNMSAEIKNISLPVFIQVLEFMYTGNVTKLNESVVDVLFAADRFGIHSLKLICEDEILKGLNTETVCDVLILGDQCDSAELKWRALIFFIDNVEEICKMSRFDYLCQMHPHLVKMALDELPCTCSKLS